MSALCVWGKEGLMVLCGRMRRAGKYWEAAYLYPRKGPMCAPFGSVPKLQPYRPSPLYSLRKALSSPAPFVVLLYSEMNKYRGTKAERRDLKHWMFFLESCSQRRWTGGVQRGLEGHLSSLLSCASSNNFGLGKSHLVSFPVIFSRTEEERN